MGTHKIHGSSASVEDAHGPLSAQPWRSKVTSCMGPAGTKSSMRSLTSVEHIVLVDEHHASRNVRRDLVDVALHKWMGRDKGCPPCRSQVALEALVLTVSRLSLTARQESESTRQRTHHLVRPCPLVYEHALVNGLGLQGQVQVMNILSASHGKVHAAGLKGELCGSRLRTGKEASRQALCMPHQRAPITKLLDDV